MFLLAVVFGHYFSSQLCILRNIPEFGLAGPN